MTSRRLGRAALLASLLGLALSHSRAVNLAEKAFASPELSISSSNVDARARRAALAHPQALAAFFQAYGEDTSVFLDPRGGTLSGAVLHVPLIPGSGMGNQVKLEQVRELLGRPVERVDADAVADLVREFIVKNREAIGIDAGQLGGTKVTPITDELWQVNIPQMVEGIPVSGARVLATVSHGNLVLVGTESWGDVAIDPRPGVSADEAVAAGFAYAGGRGCKDSIWKAPALEIVPVAAGDRYGHRLVWAFGFSRADESERWELLVDAHDRQVLALRDTALAYEGQIAGGVYPLTSNGVCNEAEFCGTMQLDWPMPYADTGLPPPNDYTNGNGQFDYPGEGTVTTTLTGKYLRVLSGCGPVTESSETGTVDLGGAAGQHDCVTSGSAGNTAPARTAFYQINKTMEAARGWLPLNSWLTSPLPIYPQYPMSCGAGYIPDAGLGFIRFFGGVSGQCLNAAEVATVVNHEWGHGLDDHDGIPINYLTSFSEGYADINAIFRSQVSCLYYGFKYGINQGCGVTPDGTGNNANEAVAGGHVHCDVQCSGHRDADWERHLDPGPDTPQNYSCPLCGSGSGPCGGEVHCGARPMVQAAWDFATRDLRAPPFNMSRQDAFVVASKLFYQGSANVGAWHSCDCAAGTSDGCAASSGYMQWLAADDDDGNLSNGTPHAGAIVAAYGRHNIACTEFAPMSHGCAAGPSAAPALVATAGMNRVDLSWSAVPGATRYRVLRTEGHAGCDAGKAVIAETAGLTYADTGLMNGRSYAYMVHAVGASGACFGPSGGCQSATPTHCSGTLTLPRNSVGCGESVSVTLEDWDLRGAGSRSISVSSASEPTPESIVLTEAPAMSGRFTGALTTTTSPAAHGDGAITVAPGDAVHLGYLDASQCGTLNVPYERIAPVDCQGPKITNVHVANGQGSTAEIRWDTQEPATSGVAYGPTAPPAHVVGPDSAYVTEHAVPVGGLQACVTQVYSVGSADRVGNATLADNGGQFFTFRTAPESNSVHALPGIPVTIPLEHYPGTLLTIDVPDFDVVEDLEVEVTYRAEATWLIQLSLIGPDFNEILLFDQRGNGENFLGTVFDDEAATAVAGGVAPFTGSFRPEQPLSVFRGKIARGTWRLRIVEPGNSGAADRPLESFELRLKYPPRTCGPDLRSAAPAPVDACSGSGAGAGNGIVEPGETVHVSFAVWNADSVPATGVSARLISYTPGVFVTSATSSYPDLAPGATASNQTPFDLYVDPGLACGAPIVLRLSGTSNEGGWSAVVPMHVGDQVPTITSYFNNTPKAIPDLGTARLFINLADTWTVTDVNVSFSIAHGAPADLDVFLVAPDGTRVELTTDNGGSFGTGYTDTVLDDEATTPITAGGGSFTGTYRPESPLSVLDGKQAVGAWTLEVTDDHQFVVGTLQRWSLTLEHDAVPPCATCPLSEAPLEVPSLAWSGTGKNTLSWSAAPRAATYELCRGTPGQLAALLNANPDSCVRTEVSTLTSGPIVTETPPLGSFQWYLVRADNAIGVGPTGSASAGARVLDPSGACP